MLEDHGTARINTEAARPAPVISDHQLLRRIGQGTYGEVWLARNVMGQYRAVKIVYRSAFAETRPFDRELDGIERFEPISRSHEGFVDVLHIGRAEMAGYFYYIMELADDREHGQWTDPEKYRPRTLSVEVKRRGRLPTHECVQLGVSLSQALRRLHEHGLVHRDIKPANIIFVQGTPKLADIGLVTEADGACSFVGTEGFVPPEGPGKPQADIYSLGMALYECSTGLDRLEFPRVPEELQNSRDWPLFLELNEVILRACQRDATKRYVTAEELHADLALIQSGQSVRRLRELEQRWTRMKQVALGLVVTIVALGVVAYQVHRERILRAEQRQHQVSMNLIMGLQALDNGHYLQALPSLIQALRVDKPENAENHRLRISTTLAATPKLMHLWHDTDLLGTGEFSPDGGKVILMGAWNDGHIKDVITGHDVRPSLGLGCFINSAAFNPSGELTLTASWEGDVYLWDWRNEFPVWYYKHSGAVDTARFDTTGDRFAFHGADPVVRVWNARTGERLYEAEGNEKRIVDFTFSHDGRKLVTAGYSEWVWELDAATGRLQRRMMRHNGYVYAVAFSPDDRLLATGGADNAAHVWDAESGRETLPRLPHDNYVTTLDWSPDGRWLATGSGDGTVRIWETDTGRPVIFHPLFEQGNRLVSVRFSPAGNQLLTVSHDGVARLWDLAGGTPSLNVTHGPFSVDGKWRLIQSNDWTQVVAVNDGKQHRPFRLPAEEAQICLNQNGKYLLRLTQTPASLELWATESGQRISRLAPFPGNFNNTTLSLQGRWLATWIGNQVQFYDMRTGQAHLTPRGHGAAVKTALFNPAEDELLTVSSNVVCQWNVATGKLIDQLKYSAIITFANYSPDGRYFVTAARQHYGMPFPVGVWETRTKRLVPERQLMHRDTVWAADLSPDMRRLATACDDFHAYIWNLDDNQPPTKLRHSARLVGARFSPDGKRILTFTQDRAARLWDTETGQPLSPPWQHETHVHDGVFLGPDKIFLFGPEAGVAWHMKPEPCPLEDLAMIGQILNGKGVQSSQNYREENAWTTQEWQRIRPKYPHLFETPQSKLSVWHYRQGRLAMVTRHYTAALFHYQRLAQLLPQDATAIALRDEAEAMIMEAQQAAP